MMKAPQNNKFLFISTCCHIVILLVLVLGFDFSEPLPVIENTNQHDVISAVILGDTAKSKVLPQQPTALPKPEPKPEPKPKPEPVKEVAKPKEVPPKPQVAKQEAVKKDVIALKVIDKKKLAAEKEAEEKKRREKIAKDLLADMEKMNEKPKKTKPKTDSSSFQKLLKQQAEKTLRQQLLDEDIKIQGTQSRMSQGKVDKYKALILQAISEHWVVPPQVNKRLYAELMIRLAPGGMVLDVQVTKTSGDPALDSSARAAVMKSSPLPVPSSPDEFEPFRHFVLRVKPENIVPN